jgi:three-Cys-motif partner protein
LFESALLFERTVAQRQFTPIGWWSEVKLEIISKYAVEYSKILNSFKQKRQINKYAYVDVFAGGGIHISKRNSQYVLGSPLNALLVEPPFDEYYLVDLDPQCAAHLRRLTSNARNVHVYEDDCNTVLPSLVYPQVRWEDRARALCLLDPYGLHLNWEVIRTAGQMRSIELFINFPIMDINRNVLRHEREKVDSSQIARMNAFWGNESWQGITSRQTSLLPDPEKGSNEDFADAFRQRLRSVAGFEHVPDPIPMRNSNNAVVYYLYFASQNKTGEKIAEYLFEKYKDYRAD